MDIPGSVEDKGSAKPKKFSTDFQQQKVLNQYTQGTTSANGTATDSSKPDEVISISTDARVINTKAQQLVAELEQESANSLNDFPETPELKRIRNKIESGDYPIDAEKIMKEIVARIEVNMPF